MSSDAEMPQGWLRYELDEAALFTAARDVVADGLRNVIEQAQNQARAQAFREAERSFKSGADALEEECKDTGVGKRMSGYLAGFREAARICGVLAEQAEKEA